MDPNETASYELSGTVCAWTCANVFRHRKGLNGMAPTGCRPTRCYLSFMFFSSFVFGIPLLFVVCLILAIGVVFKWMKSWIKSVCCCCRSSKNQKKGGGFCRNTICGEFFGEQSI